jgi:hypothetical protein
MAMIVTIGTTDKPLSSIQNQTSLKGRDLFPPFLFGAVTKSLLKGPLSFATFFKAYWSNHLKVMFKQPGGKRK